MRMTLRALSVAGVIACAVLISGCSKRASKEQVDEAQRLLDEARATIDRYNSERKEAMQTALEVKSGSERCPVKVPVPNTSGRGSTSDPMEAMSMALGLQALTTRMQVIHQPKDLTQDGPLAQSIDSDYRSALAALRTNEPSFDNDPGAKLVERARKVAKREWDWDMVVLAEQVVSPFKSGETTFKPGMLRGRAFLYLYPEKRVVCVADVAVTNSESVGVTRTTVKGSVVDSTMADQVALSEDLKVRALSAAAAGLRSVASN